MRLKRPEHAVVAADAFGEADLLVCGRESVGLLQAGRSARTRGGAAICGVLALSQRLAFVFTVKDTRGERTDGTATAYTLPALEPVPSLALHDVYGGVRAGRRMVVFCAGAVRVLRINASTPPSAQMERRIDVKGVVVGCINRRHAVPVLLAATRDEYKLLHLKTGQVTPLFPIMNGLPPLVCAFQSDFLVVQGTGRDEIATGLSITEQGEFSKSGIVLQWPSYPSCVETSGDYVFAVVDGVLFTHRVDPKTNDLSENPEGLNLDRRVRTIFKLSMPLKVHSDRLRGKLGADYMETADIVFELHSGELAAWCPPPLLLDLELRVRRQAGVEPADLQKLDAAGRRYLSLARMLMLLRENQADAAVKQLRAAETEGGPVGIDAVLYLYARQAEPSADLYPGLADLAADVRARAESGELNPQFLKVCLHKELKRSGQADRADLELQYARLLSEAELARFMLKRGVEPGDALLEWLQAQRNYGVLEQVFSIHGDTAQLFNLWQTIIRDPQSGDEDVQQAANSMVSYFTASTHHPPSITSVLPTVLDLVTSKVVSVELGLQVLQSRAVEHEDPEHILAELKERSQSGPIWRAYLKYLVYTHNILQNDLATLVVSDLIDAVHAHYSDVIKAYKRFAQLAWPKPTYRAWLVAHASEATYSADLLRLQQEFWALVERGLDCQAQLSTFESQLKCMHTERALLFESLGLHEQALELLCACSDFRAVVAYADSSAVAKLGPEACSDLAQLALRALLRESSEPAIVAEFLAANRPRVSLLQVLDMLSDESLFKTIAEYTISELEAAEAGERRAQLLYAAAKCASTLEN